MNTSETANDKSQNPQDNISLNEYGQYILIAYRFGSRERHSYLVDVCSGIDTASERAEHEVNERSGKYSVVVFAKRKTGDIEEIYEAKCPKHYYQSIGSEISRLAELENENQNLKEENYILFKDNESKSTEIEKLREEIFKLTSNIKSNG